MSISNPAALCERLNVNAALQLGRTVPNRQRRIGRTGRTSPTSPCCVAWLAVAVLAAAAFGATAQTTNPPAAANHAPAATPPPATPAAPSTETPPSAAASSPQKLDESAFGIISERNIFNANRSGGQVRLPTSRPTRLESFTLVGTMAYEKGAFAFFQGSSSEFTKAVKAEGVIAGHKLADIYAGSVKLEADGKQIDLPIGSQMRREDAGTWQVAEATASSGGGESSGSSSRRNGDSFSRRSTTTEPAGKAPASATPSAAEQSEILKRLMERREKE